ncbi:MAG: flagellar hook-associated protein FlgK [Planctomycetota bacterium]|nr:flagellar hook-associated protein FlgK [Planctomycetota bacterium]MDP6518439.1 flagellar hook-associated protein FlgK [Planctomycetota bacterium]MDP6837441.1 flagellar hook-associated protein FlgK [Planctomycetota bacterium]
MANISLNTGLRALMTSQAALQTIGHNISNANTPGYSRQSLSIQASAPIHLRNLWMGTGVDATSVERTVDQLLQKRLTGQVSSLQRLDASLTGMREFEALLGEPGGFGLGSLLDGFFESASSLATNPDDIVQRSGMVQATSQMISQFNQLSSHVDSLAVDTSQQVTVFVDQVNVVSADIVRLNQQIAQVEAGGLAANDLRDQRDQALENMAGLMDITYHEDSNGAVRVLTGGQLLVGPQRSYNMQATIEQGGNVTLMIEGATEVVIPTGGTLGGLLQFSESFLPRQSTQLDDLARNMILEVNRLHSTGVPATGPFTLLVAETALLDQDDDGQIGDELLADAGLPFDVQGGALYLQVSDLNTGALSTHVVEIDAAATTVGDFIADINDIDNLSAAVDASGRVQLSANGGFGFDFSSRLNLDPDAAGTLGGSKASIGSVPSAEYSLVDGDTLNLTGPLGPLSIQFNAADFDDMNASSPAEIVAVINADAGAIANNLRAVAVGDQVFLQTAAGGAGESFSIQGGAAAAALGWAGGTVVSGSDLSATVVVGGSYTGSTNDLLTFRPTMDGTVGDTAGLQIEVTDANGVVVTTLDVGADYAPGTELELGNGLTVSFGYGELSATQNDAFVEHVIADSDTTDVLVALGLNSLLTGSSAADIALRADIDGDPAALAASATGAEGDNGILLGLIALQNRSLSDLDGATLGAAYGDMVGNVGFDIGSAQNAQGVEQFLANSLATRREQVSGVNLDEEMVRMIQFEQAFGIASQFIQVVNELNDEILSLV